MTSTDPSAHPEDRDGPRARDIALIAIAGIGLVFGAGVIAGMVTAAVEKGGTPSFLFVVFAVAAIALVAGCVWAVVRTIPRLQGAVVSPRTRRARSMLYLSMAVGAVIGLAMSLGALGNDPRELWAGPVSPVAAMFAIAVWVIAVPLLSWRWWRNIDEHEALAYKDGALAAMYTYSAIAPPWWVGWRGGFLPEPQEMVTFVIVLAVWGMVWLARRYG